MKDTPELVFKAYKEGTISRKEANTYLKAIHNTSLKDLEPSRNWPVIGMLLFVLAFFAVSLVYQSGDLTPTGLFIHDTQVQSGETLELEVNTTIQALTASGTLTGEGQAKINFITENSVLLVADIRSDDGSPRTDKASYLPGELVQIQNVPENASYYLDDGYETLPTVVPFEAPNQSMELLIVWDAGTTRLPIVIGEEPRITTFENLCEETCVLPNITGTAKIVVTGDAFLNITLLGTGNTTVNEPPVLVIPFGNVTINDTKEIDLSLYFEDPEGSQLMFSVGESPYVIASVDGDILTIMPVTSGIDFLPVYASDLEELVQEDMLIEVIVSEISENETTTENSAHEENTETDETVPVVTTNETNTTNISVVLDCSSPDPNKRPVDCLHEQADKYFEQDVFIENIAREKVARLSPVGNFMITGGVEERSDGRPTNGDFALGYRDENFNQVFTLWIDSATGDLHLKGRLYEEQTRLEPLAGSYSITNLRGLILAYADRNTGDLYIRGNLIPYRRDIE